MCVHLFLFFFSHLSLLLPANNQTAAAAKGGGGGDKWTIHVVVIDHAVGVRDHFLDNETISVEVNSETTVEELMERLKEKNVNRRQGGDLTMKDLQPFDKSKVGHNTGHFGRGWHEGMVCEWIPKYPDATGPNCSWNPSPLDPWQKIAEAGLCDGAELCIVNTSCWKG